MKYLLILIYTLPSNWEDPHSREEVDTVTSSPFSSERVRGREPGRGGESLAYTLLLNSAKWHRKQTKPNGSMRGRGGKL